MDRHDAVPAVGRELEKRIPLARPEGTALQGVAPLVVAVEPDRRLVRRGAQDVKVIRVSREETREIYRDIHVDGEALVDVEGVEGVCEANPAARRDSPVAVADVGVLEPHHVWRRLRRQELHVSRTRKQRLVLKARVRARAAAVHAGLEAEEAAQRIVVVKKGVAARRHWQFGGLEEHLKNAVHEALRRRGRYLGTRN